MAMWVFGYGSLIWKAGFHYDERLVGYIKDYRRVFYQEGEKRDNQKPLKINIYPLVLFGTTIVSVNLSALAFLELGSTDHRGTPEFSGRTVTLEPAEGEICWGAAYKITQKKDQLTALEYLEVREKQYDKKAYVDFFTEPTPSTPLVTDVMLYIASADKKLNKNYLGPASLEEIAMQIVKAQGPSGPNREYLFKLENALIKIGCEDKHITDLANEVRRIILQEESTV